MTEIEHDRPDLPDPLDRLSRALPVVQALADLTTCRAPRWSYGVLARDVLGADRRELRVSEVALKTGIPAVPAHRPLVRRMERVSSTSVHFAERWVPGAEVPAVPAQPPLGPLLAGAEDQSSLVELVAFLDQLSGQPVRPEPDCPEAMVAASWPQMRVWLGETPPPLRWAPSKGSRRPELAALSVGGVHPVLAGLPLSAAPHVRVEDVDQDQVPGAAVVALDGRLEALVALLAHVPDPVLISGSVDVVVRWVCGRDRAVFPSIRRPADHGTTAARFADQLLGSADPATVVVAVYRLAELTARREEAVVMG